MAKGYVGSAGFAGGVYAEFGLKTDRLEQGLEAANRKMEQAAKYTERLDQMYAMGAINVNQYALMVGKLVDVFTNAETAFRKYGDALANELGRTPGIMSRVDAIIKRFGETTGFTARGFLQLSYAIDDMQYGFRSIVNNIPLIITQFGGGAGLAGVAAIAAVAFNQFGPSVEDVKRIFSGTWIGDATQGFLDMAKAIGSMVSASKDVPSAWAKAREEMAKKGSPDDMAVAQRKHDIADVDAKAARLSDEERKKSDAMDKAIAETGGHAKLVQGLTGLHKGNVVDNRRVQDIEEKLKTLDKAVERDQKEADWANRTFGGVVGASYQSIADLRRSMRDNLVAERRDILEKNARIASGDAKVQLNRALEEGGPRREALLRQMEANPELAPMAKRARELMANVEDPKVVKNRAADEAKLKKDREAAERQIQKEADEYYKKLGPEMRRDVLGEMVQGRPVDEIVSDVGALHAFNMPNVPAERRGLVAEQMARRAADEAKALQAKAIADSGGKASPKLAAKVALSDENLAQAQRDKAWVDRLHRDDRKMTEQQEKDFRKQGKEILKNPTLMSSFLETMGQEKGGKIDEKAKERNIGAVADQVADALGEKRDRKKFREAAEMIYQDIRDELESRIRAHAGEHGMKRGEAAKDLAQENRQKAVDQMNLAEKKRHDQLIARAKSAIPGIGNIAMSTLERAVMKTGDLDKGTEKTAEAMAKALEATKKFNKDDAREIGHALAEDAQHTTLEGMNKFLMGSQELPPKQPSIFAASDFGRYVQENINQTNNMDARKLQHLAKMENLLQILANNRKLGQIVIQ